MGVRWAGATLSESFICSVDLYKCNDELIMIRAEFT